MGEQAVGAGLAGLILFNRLARGIQPYHPGPALAADDHRGLPGHRKGLGPRSGKDQGKGEDEAIQRDHWLSRCQAGCPRLD